MLAIKLLLCSSLLYSISSLPRRNNDPNAPREIFAVLVAGSNTIGNYRHQADVAHSYHLLRDKGIPESNIVTLMYDDIVNDPGNPNPGKLLNEPNGPDYYPGLKIDYRGQDVNRDIFHAVLVGNKSAVQGLGTGRVLESTSADNIFVYYADHGASGYVCMPSGSGVTSLDLHSWMQEAKAANRFNQMAIYIEACESGSMLMDWTDQGFVGLTASTPYESSWATYCDSGICYADEFSITWMKNSEANDLTTFELEQQYQQVHDGVKKSSVMQYGQMTLETEPVGYFQGEASKKASIKILSDNQSKYEKVSSRDVPIYILESKIRKAAKMGENSDEYIQQLASLHKNRLAAKAWFDSLIDNLRSEFLTTSETSDRLQKEKNYDALIKEFEKSCFDLSKHTYFLEFLVQLRQYAAKDVTSEKLRFAMRTFCKATNGHMTAVTYE